MTLAEVTHRMLSGNPLAVERPDITAGRAAATDIIQVAPPVPKSEPKPKP
jgi:hypothetical protein